MTQPADRSPPAPGATPHAPRLLWPAAAAVAGFGSWMLFDAMPGLNWALWTAAAVSGLHLFERQRGHPSGPRLLLRAAPIAIAGAAAVTASPVLSVLICLSIVVLLAIQMLLAPGLPPRVITAWFAATAPPLALRNAALESMRRFVDATHLIRSPRARAWVRGLAITLPVLVVFSLLLAGADPMFAAWRDAIERLIAEWDFVPRIGFFAVLLVVVLGAYGYAAAAPASTANPDEAPPARWLGATERVILLAGVAALFWLFLAVQVGYLFGNVPTNPTSGITFAEYARRGFGELTVVATASVLLIVASERYGSADGRAGILRLLTFAVIAALLLLLGSAFRRVWLYEAAYGFTTARLYAQAYMGAVAVGLVVLTLEVAREFDAGRLFRRAVGAAMVLFIALLYWNHEGWIARQNMDRYGRTGKLDVAYLAKELSPDALPAIAEGLPALPEPLRAELQGAVRERYAKGNVLPPRAWYEWNLASSRASRVLEASFTAP